MRKSTMSGLFGGAKAPAPQPVVVNPAEDAAAAQARQDAQNAALADSKARGRASTIAAGGDTASYDQMQRGLLKSKGRVSRAATDMLGV